jgi:hypothetical protein
VDDYYHDEYAWERDGQRGWGHPPLLYPTVDGLDPDEQAANLVAATLTGAVENIGALPIEAARVGEMLDLTLAKSLAPLVGSDVVTFRLGLDKLRLDGYRLVRRWEMSEDGVISSGQDELWPALNPSDYQE